MSQYMCKVTVLARKETCDKPPAALLRVGNHFLSFLYQGLRRNSVGTGTQTPGNMLFSLSHQTKLTKW